MDTNEILQERNKTHGDYAKQAGITQELKRVMHGSPNWGDLTDSERDSLEMVAVKVGRILAGKPHFQDHWDDIAGYAKLVANQIASAG